MQIERFSCKKILSTAIAVVLTMAVAASLSPISAFAVTETEVQQAKAKYDAAKQAAFDAAETYYQALDAHDAAVAGMEEAQQKIEDTTQRIAVQQEKLSSRAVSMYRNGPLSMLDVVFGSSTFSEFATSWDLLNKLNDNDSALIASVKSLKEEQQAAYDQYAADEKESAEQLAAAEAAKADTEAKSQELQDMYNSLSSELQAQIDAAAQNAESNNASQGGGTSTGGNGGGNSGGNGGGYINNGGSGVCNVSLALAQVGKPYVYGTTGPDTFDCSGLCYYCGAPARSSASLYQIAKSRLPVSQAQAGDVLWKSGHVGISLGGNAYVHASAPGIGVVVAYNAQSAFTYVLRF